VTLRALIPVPIDVVPATAGAPRLPGLEGMTLGVMCNSKRNAPELLGALAELLCDRYAARDVVGPVRTDGVMLPSEAQLAAMAARCDVVLTGLGDCSSCSACSIHVAIDFERRGVPAVAVCTKPFLRSAEAMAARQGRPDFRFAIVQHPLSSLDMAALRTRAAEALPQVVEIVVDHGPRPVDAVVDVGRA
jgi:hypothetical protein